MAGSGDDRSLDLAAAGADLDDVVFFERSAFRGSRRRMMAALSQLRLVTGLGSS